MLNKSLVVGLCMAMLVMAASGNMMLRAATIDSRLADLAMQGDKAGVRELLKQNVDVNTAQGDGSTALHWAAYRDDVEMAEMLIKAGANVKATTRLAGVTPLFMASKNGNAAMIQLLLQAGADAKGTNANATTSLMMAAASGNTDAMKVLLDRGADVNATESVNGQTALIFAAALNRGAAIKLLAERGADLKVTTKIVPIPEKVLINSTAEKGSNRVRGEGRNNPTVMGGLTALHYAAREGHMEATRELVAAGADVNEVNAADKLSAMTQAIFNGHYDTAKFLLDHGGNPRLASTGGLTPLFATIDQQWAARTWYPAASVAEEKISYLDLMEDLLAHGADPNARMGKKLWFREFHGDWVDPEGATAFWRAAQADDVPAMRLLIARGADPNIPTLHGCSPLQVATGFGIEHQTSNFAPDARFEAVKYLVDELHADVNAKDDKGYTPLHGAAWVGTNDVINFLVSRGADVKARANMYLAADGQTSQEAGPAKGDTIADMANGPRNHSLISPDTVALLEKLGSANSHFCRDSVCVLKTVPAKKN